MKKIPYWIILIISAYQFLGTLDPALGGCSVGGFDCTGVTNSSFGQIAGIPLSFWGIIWSSLGIVLSPSILLSTLSFLGLLMAGYSLSVMGLVLHKWCLWCLVIDVNLIIISGLSLVNLKQNINPYKIKEVVLGLLLGIVVSSGVWGFHKLNQKQMPVENIISLDSSLVLGTLSGKNTLIIFTDFQCPACQRASDIVKSFIQRGDTKVIIKNYPLSSECNNSVNHNMHPWSCLAALGSVCAFEQGKLDEFYYTVYANQGAIKTKEELWRTLSFTSLNMSQLESCIRGVWAENKVQQDIVDGDKLGLQGTPTLYFNNKLIPLQEFLNN